VIASSVGAYFALGAFIRTEFRATALKTIDIAEQDIRFAVSAAPMVCVINKYKGTLKIDSLDSIRQSLDIVLSRAIPETKGIIVQIQPFDPMTKKLHAKAGYLVSDSQSTFETIDERLTDLKKSRGFWESLLSVTLSAAMIEQLQTEFDNIKQQVDEIEALGEEYKNTALAKLSQDGPGSEMVLAIAGHYIDETDKDAVSDELIMRVTAIAQSNAMYRKYDEEGCFEEYKPEIFKKVRETIHSAL
jgi:hypothetical protein